MWKTCTIILGGVLGTGLLVLALWTWRNHDPIALHMRARDLTLAALALRCGAVASAAVGEGTLVMLVIGNIWRRDLLARALGLSALLVFLLSSAGAVALVLAGR